MILNAVSLPSLSSIQYGTSLANIRPELNLTAISLSLPRLQIHYVSCLKLRNTALNFCHQMKYMVHCMVEYWLFKWHGISVSWFQYKVLCKILRITDFYFILQLCSCILKLLTCSHKFQIVVEHLKTVITWILCPPAFLCSVSVKYLTVWKLVLFSYCKNSVWKNYKLWKFVFENIETLAKMKIIYFVVMFIDTSTWQLWKIWFSDKSFPFWKQLGLGWPCHLYASYTGT
jgi:hypothetical protein